MEKGFFKVKIELTWSKLTALIMLVLAFVIDVKYNNGGTIFMYVIPFVVFLITGKQLIDGRKEIKKSNPPEQ